jgi:DNA modification methylase
MKAKVGKEITGKANPADEIERWSLDKLTPYARNSRTHSDEQVAQLAASIREWGWTTPVLVDEDGGIIAGHGRVLAARQLGMAEVPVVVARGWSDAKRRAYVIADNKLALNAGWDAEMLSLELGELGELGFDLDLTGFSDEELDGLTPSEESAALTDPDEVPEAPDVPRSVLGDVWLCGKHRVMCGDSTSVDAVGALMAGAVADLVWTDPPYNIASENKGVASNVSKAHEKLMNSAWDMNFRFEDVQSCLFAFLAENATVYVCTSHHLAPSIWAWMKEWSNHHSWCAWSKPNPMPSLMKRHWTWNAEMICYATRGKHTFNFPTEGHALSVWEIAKVNGKSGHPTEKPVDVPEHAIIHSSKSGDTVLDLFGGSGSTLIACEKTGRVARLMELDPRYVDVIVKRWQDYTGKKATREADGVAFDEVG